MANFNVGAGLKRFRTAMTFDEVTILPRFRDLIPPLTDDEFSLLKESIQKGGIEESVTLWKRGEENILIDGHNRIQVAKELKLDSFPFVFKEFDSEEDVERFMLEKQLGRRNLTDANRKYLIGCLYNNSKGTAGGSREGNISNRAEELSEQTSVSVRTVKNAGNYASGIDKLPSEEKRKVLSGETKVNSAELEKIGKDKSVTSTSIQELDNGSQEKRASKRKPAKKKETPKPQVIPSSEPEIQEYVQRQLVEMVSLFGESIVHDSVKAFLNNSEK